MTRRWLLALGTLLMTVAVTPAGAEPRERTFANGLHVLMDPDPQAAGVDVAVWYSAGLADEPAGRTGLTHLMERLMFRGSPRFGDGEYARRMGRLGATFNTFLAPDFTAFYATAPTQALGTLLELEADRMSGQRLTAANVAAETRALREEQRRLEENPLTRALHQLYVTAFGAHPYANPIQGRPADRARLTPAALTEYARSRYGSGNALVTVVGKFDPVEAESLLARSFGAVARRDPAARLAVADPPDGTRRGFARLPLRMVLVGWRAPADSVAGAELAVLAHLLGSGPRARLAAELTQRQRLAFNVSCAYDGRRRASLFYATAALAPTADSAAAERALIEQVERFAREPLTEAELTAARKALLLAARIERNGVRGRAQALGAAHLTAGHWSHADRRLERLAALTAEDIRTVAARVLTAERRSVVWTAPAGLAAAKQGARP
ncbi:MAG: pitrilysin family protein [Candidatus Eisenbacteria bacterium]